MSQTGQHLAQAFAELSKASARKKVYSRVAAKQGRHEVAHFLRAMSASEDIQARRLFNSLVGRIDTSSTYIATIFEEEIPDILGDYTELIAEASSERPALLHALSQLRSAETRLRSFFSSKKRDLSVKNDAGYFVCSFCGYLNVDGSPEKCPVCGASSDAFKEIF